MRDTLDVYWSFRSPYSYLVTPDLLKLSRDFNVDVSLRVVLPLAVRSKAALFDPSNMKPVTYILHDSFRRAEFLGLPIAFPRPDPVAQDVETFQLAAEQPYIYWLSKLGVEANRQGKGPEFAAAVSRLIWGGTENWNGGDYMKNATNEAGLNLTQMEANIANGSHLEEIEKNHASLEAAGHWGVPTLVVRGEPFFGQDRVETLRWRLEKLGLRR